MLKGTKISIPAVTWGMAVGQIGLTGSANCPQVVGPNSYQRWQLSRPGRMVALFTATMPIMVPYSQLERPTRRADLPQPD